MNDASFSPAPERYRNTTWLVYGLYAAGLFTGGLITLAGLIVAYIKRPDVAGMPFAAHLTWLIRTFWLSLLGYVVGGLLAWAGIGYVILAAVSVWYLYRLIKGFIYLNDGKPLDAQAWF
ncbi:MAG: hypothetical protein EPN72_02525 [Nevskiaceae bacterium]|nr:MAG: hypothetical protein EPN63_11155 [Nevskiaceae bacterium]TBR74434.1 MAG: hypothetical protein EPN72_02525 [Nevskiaceae bacterium]